MRPLPGFPRSYGYEETVLVTHARSVHERPGRTSLPGQILKGGRPRMGFSASL